MSEQDKTLLNKWVNSINDIQGQISTMLGWRWLWRELEKIVESNPALPKASSFFELMTANYVTSQSVGVRRVAADRTKGVNSLVKLLEEIVRNPHVITRELFLLPSDPILGIGPTDTGFAQFADTKTGKLNVNRIHEDITKLDNGVASPIKRYVDEHLAHTSVNPKHPLPTYADLDNALDLLSELVSRYVLLVTQSSMPDPVPVFQDDWRAPLRMPWIVIEDKHES